MPTLRELAIDDLIASLPEWQEAVVAPEGDTFVGALGFEDRSSIGFENWCSATRKPRLRAILVNYPFNKKDHEAQRQRFLEVAARWNVDLAWVTYKRLTVFGEMLSHLRSHAPAKIILDLSSFASFAFYPVVSAIFEAAPSAELALWYTEADSYFPAQDEWQTFRDKMKDLDLLERALLFDESHFQSRGVDCVYESLNFPGRNVDNLPTRLIVVPNFSFERVNRMIDYAASRYRIDRGGCEWIIGMPPDQQRNAWRYDALWEMYGKPKLTRSASTLDYREMLLTLHQVWKERYLAESLLVATVGSKAQHLGTLLFLFTHPEVALILAEPKEFNAARYSARAGKQWQLDFGVIQSLSVKIRDWNKVVFDW